MEKLFEQNVGKEIVIVPDYLEVINELLEKTGILKHDGSLILLGLSKKELGLVKDKEKINLIKETIAMACLEAIYQGTGDHQRYQTEESRLKKIRDILSKGKHGFDLELISKTNTNVLDEIVDYQKFRLMRKKGVSEEEEIRLVKEKILEKVKVIGKKIIKLAVEEGLQ